MWNYFEQDVERLDRYHHPHFEPGSGISDYDELHRTINQMRVDLKDETKPQAFSKIVAFVLEHAAIEVNPVDWFGLNIAGWVPDRAKFPYRVMQGIIEKWEHELYESTDESKEILELRNLHDRSGAGWSYPDNDHSKPNWDDILPMGVTGILDRVKFYRDEKIKSGEYTQEAKDYYESVIRVYEAFIRLLQRFADCARTHIPDNPKMAFLYQALSNISKKPPDLCLYADTGICDGYTDEDARQYRYAVAPVLRKGFGGRFSYPRAGKGAFKVFLYAVRNVGASSRTARFPRGNRR